MIARDVRAGCREVKGVLLDAVHDQFALKRLSASRATTVFSAVALGKQISNSEHSSQAGLYTAGGTRCARTKRCNSATEGSTKARNSRVNSTSRRRLLSAWKIAP